MSTEANWDDLRKHLPADHLAAFDAFVELLQSEVEELRQEKIEAEGQFFELADEQEEVLRDVQMMFHEFFYITRQTVSADKARQLMVKVDRVLGSA